MDMAKLAEKGKISCIFFADSYGVSDIYGGNSDATYRGGCQVAQLDPFMLVSAMASVTESVGFAVSGNAVYLNPYIFARSCSTLDHLTNGRVGWNIVTGYTNASARAMGFDSIMEHDKRYEKAEEFVDLTYRYATNSPSLQTSRHDSLTRIPARQPVGGQLG
jgi:alkanesulfonate monooxygenase SsuD/methylene tetrahydromethanopterin reductase-like flavin-dependent oxidoreductase (luciferase family)